MSKITEHKYYVNIDAPAANVWDCVTKPELIKQWLMGFEYDIENWNVGSTYHAKGVCDGNELTEKGTVLQMVPESLLEFNYLNSWEGLEDKPENYRRYGYQLNPKEGGTELCVFAEMPIDVTVTEEVKEERQAEWGKTLNELKKLAESI